MSRLGDLSCQRSPFIKPGEWRLTYSRARPSPNEYERTSHGGGGCEDPRITFVEPLQLYVMTYAALSSVGPRIAFACSKDLLHWKRLGLATFAPYEDIDFVHVDNKDASLFPVAISNHCGKMQMALLHRPLFPGTRPEETACCKGSRDVDLDHESIWISYCPMPQEGEAREPNLRLLSRNRWDILAAL